MPDIFGHVFRTVFRRIGGLESMKDKEKGDAKVFRRIGGLEMQLFRLAAVCIVFRRIGGLESQKL